MYFLYFLSNIFVLSVISYNIIYYCTRPNKNLKLINENENENECIKLICMKFYNSNNDLIKQIDNNLLLNIDDSKTIDLSYYIFNYNYIVFHYYYKNKYYKWINSHNSNQIINFPFYKSFNYKTFVYINKITKVVLDDKILDDMNILIEPFLGPNYNFYVELEYALYPNQILDYFKINYNNNSIMTLCDVFNNKIEFKMNDKLYWNPELKIH